jgi:hypothetical protein
MIRFLKSADNYGISQIMTDGRLLPLSVLQQNQISPSRNNPKLKICGIHQKYFQKFLMKGIIYKYILNEKL